MAKEKKNFYAVYYTDNNESTIVTTWTECQKKTKGRPNRFKGFASKDEAQKWLVDFCKTARKPNKKQTATDGSSTNSSSKKASFQIKMDRKALSDLRRKSDSINMPIEVLIENLILEYLYDG